MTRNETSCYRPEKQPRLTCCTILRVRIKESPIDAQEAEFAVKDLRRLRATLYLASQVGAQLGRREVLLEALPLSAAAKHGVKGGLGPSSAAARSKDHSIVITPAAETCVAMLGDFEVARSDRALLLFEAGYSPVVYFPPNDVRTEALAVSSTQTHCPFKGDASYWAAEINGKLTDIGWYYPQTFDEVSQIAGYVAFYKGRVVVTSSALAD